MGYIARAIIEARIENLMKKREEAIQNKDYHKAWILQTNIDKNITRMIQFSYLQLGV